MKKNEATHSIPFTKEQYRTLLLMVYLADWMVNSYRVEGHDENFRELEQHIFSYFKQFGQEKWIDFNLREGQHYPTQKFDEAVREAIDEYDDEMFWDELADRLAAKEFTMTYTESEAEAMSREERFVRLERLHEKYLSEFEENGLENLSLIQHRGRSK